MIEIVVFVCAIAVGDTCRNFAEHRALVASEIEDCDREAMRVLARIAADGQISADQVADAIWTCRPVESEAPA